MTHEITEKDVRTVVEAENLVRRFMETDLAKDRRRDIGALWAGLLELQQAVSAGTPLYNHAFSVAFSVVSAHESGEKIEAKTIRQGLRLRLEQIRDDDELFEAVGAPYDTYRIGG